MSRAKPPAVLHPHCWSRLCNVVGGWQHAYESDAEWQPDGSRMAAEWQKRQISSESLSGRRSRGVAERVLISCRRPPLGRPLAAPIVMQPTAQQEKPSRWIHGLADAMSLDPAHWSPVGPLQISVADLLLSWRLETGMNCQKLAATNWQKPAPTGTSLTGYGSPSATSDPLFIV